MVRGDLTDLTRQLDRMLGPDPQGAQRLAVRDDYLGDFPAEDYASVFVEAVRRVLDEASPTQSQEAPDTEVEAEEEAFESDAATPQDGWIMLRAWSAYRPLIIRMGLHLLGTICGLLAFATALAGGPALPIALLVWPVWRVRSDRFARAHPAGAGGPPCWQSGMALAWCWPSP